MRTLHLSGTWMVMMVLAAALASCAQQPQRKASASDRELPPAHAAEPAQEVISIAAVGDIMLGTDYPLNILPDDDGAGFLANVAPVLASADVTFGNLEGALLDAGEPVKRCNSPQHCFLFRTPTRYAQHLRDAGFDVMSLANNHARDFGEAGRDSSMSALDAAGILHSGRQGDVASWIVRGRRLALVAFAPNVGAHLLNDLPAARALVSELASRHDIVIVSFHGGAEGEGAEILPFDREIFHGEDRGTVVEFARTVIDAGADLVLGHGPHVVRALELYQGRLIAYSLGNFATYYGISVADKRGIAPILLVRLDEKGRFLEGRIESTVQLRPAGPVLDPERRALRQIRELTAVAFPRGALVIADDGALIVGRSVVSDTAKVDAE